MHTPLMNCCFGFQSQWRVYDVSTNYMKYTHLIYEALFWFLFKLDRFLCIFKGNALHSQLMKRCSEFQSKQRVYDVSTNYMKYTHQTYEALLCILL